MHMNVCGDEMRMQDFIIIIFLVNVCFSWSVCACASLRQRRLRFE